MSSQTEEIKQRLNLVDLVQSYVRLEKSGINFRGRCPFHQERTPSFFVSPTRQTWRCFGCQKGGDHFSFVQEIEGVEFPDALKMLADRAGVKIIYEDPKIASERSRLYAICESAAEFFQQKLTESENQNRRTPMMHYLLSRGLTEKTINDFRIGFAPDSWDSLYVHLTHKGFKDTEIEKAGLIIKKENSRAGERHYYDRYRNRIIFPIADVAGKIIGFGGRIFSAKGGSASGGETANVVKVEAKYINSPETPIYNKSKVLYAFDKAKTAIREKNECVVVEGYMDAVMSHQAGVMHTVAVSGTALTHDQLRIISRLTDTVIFAFDMDAAGQSATKRSLDAAAEFNFQRKVLILPSGKDPADSVRENPETYLKALKSARPLMDYYFEEAGKRYDVRDPLGKKNAGLFFLPHIRSLTNEIERAHWIQKFSELLSVPASSIQKELAKIVPSNQSTKTSLEATPAAKKTRRVLLEERLLCLYLHNPDTFTRLEKQFAEPIPFITLSHERLFNELKKPSKNIPHELKPLLDTLEFATESGRFDTINIEAEIPSTAFGILNHHYKEKLTDLESQIQNLEKSGKKDRIKNLLADFNAIAEKVRKYSV